MKRKRIIGIAVIVLIAVLLIAIRVKRMRQMENAPLLALTPLPVEVATVIRTKVVQTVHVLGTVIGADEAAVAPQVMARVLEVKVREGDRVKAGQLLAQLDSREFRDAVTAAKASLAAAQMAQTAQAATTARDRKLYEVKATALEQWQNSQAAEAAALAQLKTARERLDQAQTQLGYCGIVAPMEGLIARRLADPGDLAVPGKPLFEFVRQKTVRVRAELPPEDWTRLHVGQEVMLTWKNHSLKATVSRVFPAMNDSQLATIEVDLAQPPTGFVSGATVGVDVAMNSAEGLAVPADALLEGDRGDWVFIVKNGAVRPVPVTVRARSNTQVVVTGDLAAGDAVVEAEPSRLMTLTEGMKVAGVPASRPPVEKMQ